MSDRPTTDPDWVRWADDAIAARREQGHFTSASRRYLDLAQGRRGERYDYYMALYRAELSKAHAATRWAIYCDSVANDIVNPPSEGAA